MNSEISRCLCFTKLSITFIIILGICTLPHSYARPKHITENLIYQRQYTDAPLLFTENKGQVSDAEGNPLPKILFTASSKGLKIYLTATGIHYQFFKTTYPPGYTTNHRKVQYAKTQQIPEEGFESETAGFTLSLKGANVTPHIRRDKKTTYTENFYYSHCAISNAATYEQIVYENVYPGIDWVVYIKNQHLEHDFIVHPNADPGKIKLQIGDAEKVSISTKGELQIRTRLGEINEAAPVAYIGKMKVPILFRQEKNGIIRFDIAKYDATKTLLIDPSVTWATYYGGNDWDIGYSCTSDSAGNVYLSGYTASSSNISSGGYQNTQGGDDDAFLVKFNSSGVRLWATYYGGTGSEYGYSCTMDKAGNVYMAGRTTSTNGIAAAGFQNTFGGGNNDAFLVKFTSNGQRQWATYYGGSSNDNSTCCRTDSTGNIYLSGSTGSTSNIAFNGFQNIHGGNVGISDAFLVKFNSAGGRLWATYYGDGNTDIGFYCTVDRVGNVYLSGNTSSTINISSGGFQNTYGGGSEDAFLVKFDSSGGRLWATYYGGSDSEWGLSCATDTLNNVYLCGYTGSISGIASGGFQNTLGGGFIDAFLVKFSSSGNRFWATYYGGNGIDDSRSCTVDANNNVYLTGRTLSGTGIAFNGVKDTYSGGQDAFLVKFNSNGGRLWATYYGGSGEEDGYACTTDVAGNVYISGTTSSASGIASGGFQNIYGGSNYDAFLVKIADPATTGFTSVANGNWNNPAVWSGGVVPTAGATVVINTTITITSNVSCYTLKVNPSGSVIVGAGFTLTVLH